MIGVRGSLLVAAGFGSLALLTMAGGQPPMPPEPPKEAKPGGATPDLRQLSLEDMLAMALAHNPDLRVADLKARELEAERDRLKLQTIQKVRATRSAFETQQRLAKLLDNPTTSVQERLPVLAKLAELEGELMYLLGIGASRPTARLDLQAPPALAQIISSMVTNPVGPGLAGALAPPPHEEDETPRHERPAVIREAMKSLDRDMAGRLKDLLAMRIVVKPDAAPSIPLGEAMARLRETVPQLGTVAVRLGQHRDKTVEFAAGEQTVGAMLQGFQDDAQCEFLVRNYGLLLVDANDGYPPGTLTMKAFLMHVHAKDEKAK